MDRMNFVSRLIVCLAALAAGSLLTHQARAQFNPLFPADANGESDLSLLKIPQDPLTKSTLSRAVQRLNGGEVAAGLQTLQAILDEGEDFLLSDEKTLGRSLFHVVEELIGNHQADYQRLYGATAEQQLNLAISTQDAEIFADLIRRYRWTEAGQQAVRLRARIAVSRGDPERAANLLIEQVRNHPAGGFEKDLAHVVNLLARSELSETVQALQLEHVAGLDASLLANLDSVPQQFDPLADREHVDWPVPQGSATQAGRVPFAPVLLPERWVQPLIDPYDFFLGSPDKEQALLSESFSIARSKESNVWSNSDRIAMPAGRPLVVGDQVVVPGFGTVKAFDAATGEVTGVGVNVDQTFEYLFQSAVSPNSDVHTVPDEFSELFFAVRGWRDLTSASLSSDGRYVFAVRDSQLVGSVNPEHLVRSSQRHELLPQPFNQLHAYELDAGLRKRWSLGTVEEMAEVPFDPVEDQRREIFFYSAPLPVQQQLFVIGEERGQIRLYEIEAETGSIVWSVGLLNPSQLVTLDTERRLSGLMPSYAAGLLICPTGEGVLTAVDPLTRRVQWSFQYSQSRQEFQQHNRFRWAIRQNRGHSIRETMEALLEDDRWFDVRSIPIGPYLLHTPPDANELICLNGRTGESVWQQRHPRLRSVMLATAYRETAILVGKQEIAAIRASDGQRVWSLKIPRPSGRGVRMENHYLQPLMTGEVAIIDLETGRQVTRIVLPGKRVIGNLVASGGRLFAQSATEILAYLSLSEVESLIAESAHRDQARQHQGELELQRGHREAGIRILEEVDSENLSEGARTSLAWAKIEQLKADFSKHREQTHLIDQLIHSSEQRFELYQTIAQGLAAEGDRLQAFEQSLQLFEFLSQSDRLLQFDGNRESSRKTWVLSQLLELRTQSDAALQAEMDAALSNWLQDTAAAETVARFVNEYPGTIPQSRQVLDRLADVERTAKRIPLLTAAYRRMIDGQLQDQIIARRELAQLALQLQDGSTALAHLHELTQLPEPAADTGLSPAEIAASVRSDQQWAEVFHAVPQWPTHVVETEKPEMYGKSPRFQIPVFGPQSLPLRGWTFFLNPMGTHVDVYNADGLRVAQVATSVVAPRQLIGPRLARYVSTYGHSALIVLADRFLLIDFQQDQETPRLVTQQTLITEEQNPFGVENLIFQNRGPEPGFRTVRSYSFVGTLAGNVGPIRRTSLCFGVGERLTCLDPVSGDVKWQRFDLPHGSEIFSDDEYVLTLDPQASRLTIYRTLDGVQIGQSDLPQGVVDSSLDRENGDWGRYFPRILETADNLTFAMYDPVTETDVWEFSAQPRTQWATVNGEHIAFLDPEGVFTLVNGLSGAEIVHSTLPVAEKFQSLAVLERNDRWIVIPGKGRPLRYDFSFQEPLIARSIEKTAHGTVCAIDRSTGDLIWSRELQDQKLITQSPTHWPILFFGNGYGRNVRGQVLNLETGADVVKGEWEYDRSWIHWQASTQPTMRIRLAYGRHTVSVDCVERLGEESAPEKPDNPPAPPQ